MMTAYSPGLPWAVSFWPAGRFLFEAVELINIKIVRKKKPGKKLVKQVKRTLKPYADDVVIEDTYDMDEHAGFYRKITVLSVPLRFQEGVGLYLCEAFAAGRPAVEPNTGSFAEIVGMAF